MASESLLADILIDKYVYHLPFYRVIQKYKELGVLLSDSTIGDWFNAVCSKLRPLYDKLRERIMSSDYIQVDESTLPVIDNEKHRAVKGYIWAVRDAVCGDVYFHYDMGSRGGDTARKLIGGYRGTIQTDGYEVYEAYEGAPGKRMIGCWAHARRKFVEALDEDKKYASEALVYIGKLYGIEKEMQEAGLDHDAIQKRRQEESYKIIQEFENWMDSVSGCFTPKSRMGKALVYTYTLLPRLSRYVLDGRYNIDNNGVGVSRGHYNMMLLAGIMEILSATIKEMRVGPSQSVYRNRLQTITSCVLSNQKVVNVVCNKSEDMVRYV